RGNFQKSGQVDAAISSLLSTSAISPYLPLRASSRSELQNLLRVVPAARQHLCPDVSVFDQTDRTPVGTMNSYVRHQAHARQFTRPNWERLSWIPARCVAAVAFCLLRP